MDDRQVIQKLGAPCVAKRLNLAPSSVRVYAMRGIPISRRWAFYNLAKENSINLDCSFMDNPKDWQPKKQVMISPVKKIGKGI